MFSGNFWDILTISVLGTIVLALPSVCVSAVNAQRRRMEREFEEYRRELTRRNK